MKRFVFILTMPFCLMQKRLSKFQWANILLLLLMLGCFDLSAQDTTLRYIKKLNLKLYLNSTDVFDSEYIINENYVVYESADTRKIFYPDMASLKSLGRTMAKDKNGVYIEGKFIKTDTTGFKLLGRQWIGYNSPLEYLWKTKYAVFKDDSLLKGVDPQSFVAVSNISPIGSSDFYSQYLYFKDRNNLYCFDKKIDGSDPKTSWVSPNTTFLCFDKNNVYRGVKSIRSFDGQKLYPVNNRLYKTIDKVIPYTIGDNQVMSDVDASSLQGLSSSVSMDKNHIYCDTTTLPIQFKDLDNIKVWEQSSNIFISDGKRIYRTELYRNQLSIQPNLDAESFGTLYHDYFFDKKAVYYREYLSSEGKVIIEKTPFKYHGPVSRTDILSNQNSRYIIYENQAFDSSEKKLYVDLTDEDLSKLKSGYEFMTNEKLLAKPIGDKLSSVGKRVFHYNRGEWKEQKNIDGENIKKEGRLIKNKKHVYIDVDFSFGRNGLQIIKDADPITCTTLVYWFFKDKNWLFFGEQKIMSSEGIQLLAFYNRHGVIGHDSGISTEYFFFKNKKGYWFIETTHIDKIVKLNFLGRKFNRNWNPAFRDFELPRN